MTATPAQPAMRRNVAIAVGVVLVHAVALWALNTGRRRQAAEAEPERP